MIFGSLFSGIGGFELGLEGAGMECAWQVENDKHCNEVLAERWPTVERSEDVEDAGASNLTAVDLICGGFPCQDLSMAGKRRGLAGDRSGLWEEFRRVVSELCPKWVLIENVTGLLSSDDGRDLGVILRGLEELGYGWFYRVLDSQYFGVAQRRRRVFIIGYSGGRCPAEILFDPASLQRHPPTRREKGERVAALTARGVGTCGADDNQAQAGHIVAYPVSTKTRYGDSQENYVAHALTSEGHDASEDGTGRGTPIVVGDGRPLAFGPRRLTPRECERLQGFPDDWTLVNGMADSPRYRMLGNAVTVSVTEWIGNRIAHSNGQRENCK